VNPAGKFNKVLQSSQLDVMSGVQPAPKYVELILVALNVLPVFVCQLAAVISAIATFAFAGDMLITVNIDPKRPAAMNVRSFLSALKWEREYRITILFYLIN
jgi:hypothetical protein